MLGTFGFLGGVEQPRVSSPCHFSLYNIISLAVHTEGSWPSRIHLSEVRGLAAIWSLRQPHHVTSRSRKQICPPFPTTAGGCLTFDFCLQQLLPTVPTYTLHVDVMIARMMNANARKPTISNSICRRRVISSSNAIRGVRQITNQIPDLPRIMIATLS